MFPNYLNFSNRFLFSNNVYSVGFSSVVFTPASNRRENAFWSSLKELVPECRDYGWPDRSADAELKSFCLQASKHRDIPKPDYQKCILEMAPFYLRFDLPVYCGEFNADLVRGRVYELLDSVNKDASPGIPWSSLAVTNGQLIKVSKDQLVDCVVERIHMLSTIALCDLYAMSAEERVLRGFNDPVRVFVKDEPHKRKKLDEGRVRLIMSVSIADKLVEMFMRKFIHDLEIKNWYRIPNKPGIGFTDDMCSMVYNRARSMFQVSTDVSGFDWGYQEWDLEFDVDFKIHLCNNPSAFWKALMHNYRVCMSDVIFSLSDGRMFSLAYRGIMLSGRYCTGNANSTVRNFKACLIGAFPSDAMGDDCLERFVDDAKSKYEKVGVDLKVYQPITDSFEFCSRLYFEDRSYTVNVGKLLMNLVHSDVSDSYKYQAQMRAFESDVYYHPDYHRIYDALERIGFTHAEWSDEEYCVGDAI